MSQEIEKRNDCEETGAEESSGESLSHAELLEFFQESVKHLVKIDPILKDLHPQVTLEEVEALLALEQGHAITVYVHREFDPPWKVVIPRDSTVYQLKLALKHHATLTLGRENCFKKLSWKYIWRTYWLSFGEIKLTDDNKKLSSYYIKNKSKLDFVKKLSKENS